MSTDRNVNELEQSLRGWGATVHNVMETGSLGAGDVTVDFETPFPGDQPIWSSAKVTADGVTESTIRYGVLDESRFISWPTDDIDQVHRLTDTVAVGPIDGALVYANYGDRHRRPRPHAILGWVPPDAPGVPSREMRVADGVTDRAVPVGAYVDWVMGVGRRIRREYRDEWDESGGDR